MKAEVHGIDGSSKGSIELPGIFSEEFREDLVRRAILSEQSYRRQPQGHNILAGMRTTAVYVGKYDGYRRGRHMGIAIRPRQKLGGGAMGDVRRIPSSVKGRRAHPHMIEKDIIERINSKEHSKAIESALAGFAKSEMIKERYHVKKETPIVVEDALEGIAKTKDLIKTLNVLGIKEDLEKSHKRSKGTSARRTKQRHFRKSAVIIVNNSTKVEKAGRNIPGIDVININNLNVETLAPGGQPRLSIWSRSAIENIEKALKK